MESQLIERIKKKDKDAFKGLYAVIKELEDTNRIPLVLKYLKSFKEEEIANILNLNVNTVKSRLLKGRQKLKLAIIKYLKGVN